MAHVPPTPRLDVFWLRDQLVQDYHAYINSFIQIRDPEVQTMVTQALAEGLLCPDPLIQLNPSFEPGAWIDDLVKAGTLHPACARIFRKDKDRDSSGRADSGAPLRLHVHQRQAIEIARAGQSYVLTTGTGSGKSLAYIVPIVDAVLRHGSGRGIQAIIVYPMNTLANSQYGELEKFLLAGFPDGSDPPVTFRRYTGQETAEQKEASIRQPPDILLTNFVMLELMLTRLSEQAMVEAARGLHFLVLDELHTYRGRQGADVALLVRRVRNRTGVRQCVGTSATLAGPGTEEAQRIEVARVASQLFGVTVQPAHVIGETLRRVTPSRTLDNPHFQADLTRRLTEAPAPPLDFAGFVNDPLSIWIETTFGVTTDPQSGRLKRSEPKQLTGPHGAAHSLHTLTGVPEPRCVEQIQQGLLASYACEPDPRTGFPPFAFRLHQFISRGDTVYATLHPPGPDLSGVDQSSSPSDATEALTPNPSPWGRGASESPSPWGRRGQGDEGSAPAPYQWDEGRRFLLRCELANSPDLPMGVTDVFPPGQFVVVLLEDKGIQNKKGRGQWLPP